MLCHPNCRHVVADFHRCLLDASLGCAVYVLDTSHRADMRVQKRHRHVDQNGLIYLPYLHAWDAGKSTLDELLSFMSSVFSDDPPVYKYDPVAKTPVREQEYVGLDALITHCAHD